MQKKNTTININKITKADSNEFKNITGHEWIRSGADGFDQAAYNKQIEIFQQFLIPVPTDEQFYIRSIFYNILIFLIAFPDAKERYNHKKDLLEEMKVYRVFGKDDSPHSSPTPGRFETYLHAIESMDIGTIVVYETQCRAIDKFNSTRWTPASIMEFESIVKVMHNVKHIRESSITKKLNGQNIHLDNIKDVIKKMYRKLSPDPGCKIDKEAKCKGQKYGSFQPYDAPTALPKPPPSESRKKEIGALVQPPPSQLSNEDRIIILLEDTNKNLNNLVTRVRELESKLGYKSDPFIIDGDNEHDNFGLPPTSLEDSYHLDDNLQRTKKTITTTTTTSSSSLKNKKLQQYGSDDIDPNKHSRKRKNQTTPPTSEDENEPHEKDASHNLIKGTVVKRVNVVTSKTQPSEEDHKSKKKRMVISNPQVNKCILN
ncbi:hypothetical protein CYY_009844 [Polysphondylium violaceum]|uniref:Uncharacterized protein n=1 Tax=Polysphondylium violaceum TaxID=133409 RepID=A0A8J4V2K0_9MYCE|nr:hypothetical protein CYY_009844 [Polysphondylium violaceum]